MTRDEAKDYNYSLDVDGYYYEDVEKVIDNIFDYFENRTCGSCKYKNTCILYSIMNKAYSGSLVLDKPSCGKWEESDDYI